MKAILAKKIGMTNYFNSQGEIVPVTLVEAGPCVITQIKSVDKDSYEAVQIGFSEAKKVGKALKGHLAKSKAKSKYLQEVKTDSRLRGNDKEGSGNDKIGRGNDKEGSGNDKIGRGKDSGLKVGDKITCNIFDEGDKVHVTGLSKGKGFAGAIKRHNFHRGPMTHGSRHHRKPGSIGAMFPQHVFKGTKLPGQMGHQKTTVKNLKIEKVDAEKNILAVKGAIPGPKRSIVLIKSI